MNEESRSRERLSFSLLGYPDPGLEPGKAGPESAVLPLHHSPIGLTLRKRGQR